MGLGTSKALPRDLLKKVRAKGATSKQQAREQQCIVVLPPIFFPCSLTCLCLFFCFNPLKRFRAAFSFCALKATFFFVFVFDPRLLRSLAKKSNHPCFIVFSPF